jgi:hypothetical protein
MVSSILHIFCHKKIKCYTAPPRFSGGEWLKKRSEDLKSNSPKQGHCQRKLGTPHSRAVM